MSYALFSLKGFLELYNVVEYAEFRKRYSEYCTK
jgi:hypothetical protein